MRSRPARTTIVAVAACALLWLAAGVGASNLASGAPANLFGAASLQPDGAAAQRDTPMAARRRYVTVDTRLISSDGPAQIGLNLFGDITLTAVRDRVEQRGPGRLTWYGTVAGDRLSSVVIVSEQGRVAGNIRTGAATFQVAPAAGTLHAVTQLDEAAFPEEVQPVVPPRPPGPQHASPIAKADGQPQIDVLVVYTAQARAAAGGTAPMQALIQLAVDETNQAYANSGISQRLRLAHSAEVSYVESSDIAVDLTHLVAPADGSMDEVHALRDTYGADLVSLWKSTDDYCGLGYLMQTPSADFAPYGFSVVNYICATGYYSFGHELGHNMGATHDRASAGAPGAYPYSYGYQSPSGSWRTIMAYNCPGGCPRIQYFSNPAVPYAGVFTGVAAGQAAAADNAQTLNNTAAIVAAFRGAIAPTATPTPTATSTATATLTASPTPTVTSSVTATPTATSTATATSPVTPTPTSTETLSPPAYLPAAYLPMIRTE